MDWEVSREELKGRVERILSSIMSDKFDMNITIKFRDRQENEDEKGRSNQDVSRHRANARERARRLKGENATN